MLDQFINLPIFKDVSESYLKNLESECSEIILKKDDFLFRQGDTGSGMYIVTEGGIEIIVDANSDSIVSTLETGASFGEISLFEKQTRIASAKANSETKLLYLDFEKFADQINNNDINALRISHNIALLMVERLEKANELLTKFQLKSENKNARREVSRYKEKLLEEGLF